MNKRGEIVVSVLVGLAVAVAGILMTTSKHNSIVAAGNAERVYLGVKAPIGPGVASAVARNKGEAALSVLAGIAAGVATDKLNASDSKGGGSRVEFTGDNNVVNYNEKGYQDRHDNAAPAPAQE